MKILNLDRESIVFKMTTSVIILIILQSLFLGGMLVFGGVLSQAEQNAFQSFNEKVENKNDSLKRIIKGKWTNMSPYAEHISKTLSNTESNEEFFKAVSEDLITLLRATETTGAFIILDSEDNNHDSLYIRDYDPSLNDYSNKDLYMLLGSPEIAKQKNIPLDQSWKYKMKFDQTNKDLFEKPYSNANLTFDSTLLGYWNSPFKLIPGDISIMTYSMPLFDGDNNLRGVIGVEVSENYFIKSLPNKGLQSKNSIGYLLGYSGAKTEKIKPALINGALQKQIINADEDFSLTEKDSGRNIYKVNNIDSQQTIYACIEPFELYNLNTPFEDEAWYLIAMMNESYLLSYVNKIRNILIISLITSIVIGVIGGYIISYRLTKPITKLVKQVKESDADKVISLDSTGLKEIDELSVAMEKANNALLESALKMSQIIDLAGFPIGAFESSSKYKHIFFTDQLSSVLNIDCQTMQTISKDKDLFFKEIKSILKNKLEGEEDVYKLDCNIDKYVKVKIIENADSKVGVAIDVSKEVIEKNQIKMERDYDPLTMIFNRKAARLRIENIIANVCPLNVSALIMFDLDNLKITNDTYGHKWGDFYIIEAVSALKEIAKSKSVLGRRSGDEFVLFLFSFDSRQSVIKVIDDFYDKLSKNLLEFPNGTKKPVKISGGLLWIDDLSQSYDEMLHRADELLYKAKTESKGSYQVGSGDK